MTIEETYNRIIQELSVRYDTREVEQITCILLADMFGITNPKRQGQWEDQDGLENAIARLIGGEPIQYVTGLADFYGRQFRVNKNVLIPRPETEELVYNVIKHVKSDHKQYDVLDIGTGSGCIPITLKKEQPSCSVFAMDYSQDVLNLAKINAKRLQAQIAFYKFDFLDESFWTEMGCFDIIISNPPYIADEERSLMADTVLDFEPERALFALGDDPLVFYRKIAVFAETHLNEGGSIFLELNQYHAAAIDAIYKSAGYRSVLIQDLQGNDRMLKALKN